MCLEDSFLWEIKARRQEERLGTIYILLFPSLFAYLCVCVCARGEQSRACRSWLSASTTQILETELRAQDWWQVHLLPGSWHLLRSIFKTGNKLRNPSLSCGGTELEDKGLCSSRAWTGQRTRSASCWAELQPWCWVVPGLMGSLLSFVWLICCCCYCFCCLFSFSSLSSFSSSFSFFFSREGFFIKP